MLEGLYKENSKGLYIGLSVFVSVLGGLSARGLSAGGRYNGLLRYLNVHTTFDNEKLPFKVRNQYMVRANQSNIDISKDFDRNVTKFRKF